MGTYWSWSLLRKGRSCYTLDKEWNTRKEKKLFVSSRIFRWTAWKAYSGRHKEKKKTRPWPIPHSHGHQTLPMWILRVRREPVIIRSKKNKVSCAHVQTAASSEHWAQVTSRQDPACPVESTRYKGAQSAAKQSAKRKSGTVSNESAQYWKHPQLDSVH